MIFFSLSTHAQDEVKKDLDSTEIAAFQDEAFYIYKLYFESILNILDPDISLEDKYRSKSVLTDLFFNISPKYIEDIVNTATPRSYSPHVYTNLLLNIDSELPIYYKKYKFSEGFSDIDDRTKNLDSDNFIIHRYIFKKYILERLINSQHIDKSVLNSPTFNAYENDLLKSVEFRIDQNVNKEYQLTLQNIDIESQKNISLPTSRKEILDSKYEWSDKAEEGFLAKAKIEAKSKGLEILPNYSSFEEIEIDSTIALEELKKDSTLYLDPSSQDYLIPGLGHMKYGRYESVRKVKTFTYATVFIGSTTYAIFSKVKSNSFYNDHLDAETFRLSGDNLKRAENYNDRFLIASSIALGTFIANAVHIKVSHSIQLNRLKEANYRNEGVSLSFDLNPNLTSLASLKLEF